MKIRIIVGLVMGILLQTSVFANTYVKCGVKADFESFSVSPYELELSSEGSDEYSGPVGINWNMKLGSEDSEWLAPNTDVVARTSVVAGETIVDITVKYAEAATGPVGIRYKLIGLFNEGPVLEKYSMGGFLGTYKLASFECLSAHD